MTAAIILLAWRSFGSFVVDLMAENNERLRRRLR